MPMILPAPHGNFPVDKSFSIDIFAASQGADGSCELPDSCSTNISRNMNLLSAENISKSYTGKLLLDNASFGISKGDKVALVAPNGAGKSTLMRLVAGKDVPDSGLMALREGVRIGYLQQEPEFDNSLTIDELLGTTHTDVLQVIRNYETALTRHASDPSVESEKNLEKATLQMDVNQAWDYERRLKELLSEFRIDQLQQSIQSLSGGQKKRLAMVFALLDDPDLLLLDEPTNHLDIEMIEWLEDYLDRSGLSLLMVTHDRYFLNRVCSQIWELDEGKIYTFLGNYEYFLEKKAEREANLEKEIHGAKRLMLKELEWIRRMPKARTTKSKSRIDNFYEIEAKASSGKNRQKIELQATLSRIGGKILDIKNISKSFGENVLLHRFSYSFRKGERIGIVGSNGVGKTTFLNLIMEQLNPDEGTIEKGETIVFGYYEQKGMSFREDKRVIEVLKDIAEIVEMKDGKTISVGQLLQKFLFTSEQQYTYVSKLSGGEKRRLYLLTVLLRNPNFLIMDEPTNDLDIMTLNALEDFLSGYAGCLILVSHDRYFMDKLVDQLFIFKGRGEVEIYTGGYTAYRDWKEQEDKARTARNDPEKEKPKEKVGKETATTTRLKLKLSFKEKKELADLEIEIKKLELEKSELETSISTAGNDYVRLREWSERIQKVMELIDAKTLRWMELSELNQ